MVLRLEENQALRSGDGLRETSVRPFRKRLELIVSRYREGRDLILEIEEQRKTTKKCIVRLREQEKILYIGNETGFKGQSSRTDVAKMKKHP